MPTHDNPPEISPTVFDWLRRQTPEVQETIRAAVESATDAAPAGAIDCMRRLSELDIAPPSGNYFTIAHDLLDNAGSVAFHVGVAHSKSENELRIFLSLAGTALFGDRSAIARFENGFGPGSALDDIVLFLQAELEMLGGGFPGE